MDATEVKVMQEVKVAMYDYALVELRMYNRNVLCDLRFRGSVLAQMQTLQPRSEEAVYNACLMRHFIFGSEQYDLHSPSGGSKSTDMEALRLCCNKRKMCGRWGLVNIFAVK